MRKPTPKLVMTRGQLVPDWPTGTWYKDRLYPSPAAATEAMEADLAAQEERARERAHTLAERQRQADERAVAERARARQAEIADFAARCRADLDGARSGLHEAVAGYYLDYDAAVDHAARIGALERVLAAIEVSDG